MLSITLSCQSSSQRQAIANSFIPQGTIIVALICEDGIVFASDSRSSFILNEENSKKVYAFFDNDQKLFAIDTYIIASSGLVMLNKKFLRQIVDEFNISSPKGKGLENTFDDFIDFLKTKQNLSDSLIFDKNEIIIAGYENSRPLIVARDHNGKMKQENKGYMIHSDPRFRDYVKVARKTKLTCNMIAPLLEKAIYDFANFKNDYKIGGPINIIKINPDNSHTILKSFVSNKFKNYKEMAEAIFNKGINVNYVFPFSEDLLNKTLQEGIEMGY